VTKITTLHPVLLRRFAANLKRERLRQGLTHETLAARARITSPYVSMMEAGLKCPTLYVIEACAKALKMKDPSQLLKENES
jgi:transcriptional regulator with XRE-family HTH domain